MFGACGYSFIITDEFFAVEAYNYVQVRVINEKIDPELGHIPAEILQQLQLAET
jgi:hypothetical protein